MAAAATAPAMEDICAESLKRTRQLFGDATYKEEKSKVPKLSLKQRAKLAGEYATVKDMQTTRQQAAAATAQRLAAEGGADEEVVAAAAAAAATGSQLALHGGGANGRAIVSVPDGARHERALSVIRKNRIPIEKPKWRAPWKLKTVISGHLGWVRAVAVDPANEWFATGAGDRTIKIWDLASGSLKLTLTGHISCVRGLAVSPRQPYLFSCAEDKTVKCWDLEQNKVIRHYHGHLSGVYCMALHPTLDVLMTGGRDSTCRVWDIRTKSQVHVLAGHTNTVVDIKCQNANPQVVTGAMDSTVRFWDLAAGKRTTTLTHHKKSVRALCIHPREYTMASASADNIKKWKFPKGELLKDFSGHNAVINTLSVNEDGVCFSGGDNGSMKFWDWKTGYNFQSRDTIVQPGSLESEAGFFTSSFDQTGTRLITGEADKTIKIWQEDQTATPESHPVNFKPNRAKRH